jgi:hypothetical protein
MAELIRDATMFMNGEQFPPPISIARLECSRATDADVAAVESALTSFSFDFTVDMDPEVWNVLLENIPNLRVAPWFHATIRGRVIAAYLFADEQAELLFGTLNSKALIECDRGGWYAYAYGRILRSDQKPFRSLRSAKRAIERRMRAKNV